MKSVLKKFEKNSIDMSKIYGQGYWNWSSRTATSGGAVLSGMEYIKFMTMGVYGLTWQPMEEEFMM